MAVETIALLPHQHEAMTAPEPFVALVTGLGGGKTWTGARWIISRAVSYPESLHLVTVNSHPQARDLVTPAISAALDELSIPYQLRIIDSKFLIDVGDRKAEIRVRSTEKTHVDKLRGSEYGSWWADEARDCSRYAFQVIKSRLRCTKVDQPRYLLTTTPRGFDWIYEEHITKADERKKLVRATSWQNPFLTREYVAGTLGDLDEDLVSQEREGQFIALGAGAVYKAFDRRIHAARSLPYDSRRPVMLCADFNVGFYGWVLCQAHERVTETGPGRVDHRREVHVIAEHTPRNCTVEQAAIGLLRDPRWAAHSAGWRVYPDAAGSNQRNRQTGRTDTEALIQAMRALGAIDVQDMSVRSNPPVHDRVSAVNAMLRNAKGEVRLFVDPSCRELMRDMEQLVWRNGGADIDKAKDGDRSHCSDALGYYVHAEHAPSAFRAEPGYAMRSSSR